MIIQVFSIKCDRRCKLSIIIDKYLNNILLNNIYFRLIYFFKENYLPG